MSAGATSIPSSCLNTNNVCVDHVNVPHVLKQVPGHTLPWASLYRAKQITRRLQRHFFVLALQSHLVSLAVRVHRGGQGGPEVASGADDLTPVARVNMGVQEHLVGRREVAFVARQGRAGLVVV